MVLASEFHIAGQNGSYTSGMSTALMGCFISFLSFLCYFGWCVCMCVCVCVCDFFHCSSSPGLCYVFPRLAGIGSVSRYGGVTAKTQGGSSADMFLPEQTCAVHGIFYIRMGTLI